jgi:hypothetical protein
MEYQGNMADNSEKEQGFSCSHFFEKNGVQSLLN